MTEKKSLAQIMAEKKAAAQATKTPVVAKTPIAKKIENIPCQYCGESKWKNLKVHEKKCTKNPDREIPKPKTVAVSIPTDYITKENLTTELNIFFNKMNNSMQLNNRERAYRLFQVIEKSLHKLRRKGRVNDAFNQLEDILKTS